MGIPRRRFVLAAAGVLAMAAAIAALAIAGGGSSGDDDPGATGGPASAAQFADSVGVNIHSTYGDTPYADATRVLAALRGLGVRQVRDGFRPDVLAQSGYLAALARHGIRSTLILGSPRDDVLGALRRNGGLVARAGQAVEGPNEYDVAGDPAWVEQLRRYQGRLYAAVRGARALGRRPVIGPSFATSDGRRSIGDLSRTLDAVNIHPYPGGRPPETNIGEEIASIRGVGRGKPVVATETGYHNALAATAGQPPASEAAAATYLPRMLLENFRLGVRRTFLYELLDEHADPGDADAEQHFGLLRNDFTPKPAYRAVQRLLAVIGRGGASGDAPPLGLRVDAPAADVRRLLLAQGHGRYVLALWRPVSVWDEQQRRDVTADARRVPVRLARTPKSVTVYRPSAAAGPVGHSARRPALEVDLAGDVVLLAIDTGENG